MIGRYHQAAYYPKPHTHLALYEWLVGIAYGGNRVTIIDDDSIDSNVLSSTFCLFLSSSSFSSSFLISILNYPQATAMTVVHEIMMPRRMSRVATESLKDECIQVL